MRTTPSRSARRGALSGPPRLAWLAALALAFGWLATSGCLEPDAAPNTPAPPWAAPASAPAAPAPATGAATPSPSRVPAPTAPARPSGANAPADPVLARLASKPLRYTRHGRCRMGCRHISQAEVRALLDDGRVAPERTRHDGECASYAVEGRTDDGQDVRIVYADCARETRVVTTIDLGRDWPCSCR